MNVIHLGSGAGNRLWVRAVERCSGARNIAQVADDNATTAGGAEIPRFQSLTEALASVSADVAVVSGNRAIDWACQALRAKLAVVVQEVGVVDGAAFRAFRDEVKAKGSTVVWQRRYPYARCEKMLKWLIGSKRLGGLGHVSCIDHAAALGDDANRSLHASTKAFTHFQALQRLFGSSPGKIMARLGSEPGLRSCTEAFLEFGGGLNVHYSGYFGAQRNEHQLWIEGAEGSVRTDGSAVWWRKRGWRYFLPLKFSFERGQRDSDDTQATLDALAAARAHTARWPDDLSAVAMVAAAFESNHRRASVALSELLG